MVKIPSFDELKKMGTQLIDSAKTIKFSEMVDKVKAGVESVSGKKSPVDSVTDETFKSIFQGIFDTLNEMTESQAKQLNALKRLEDQLEMLAKTVEINNQSSNNTNKEEKNE